MADYDWLWPSVKNALYSDIPRVIDRSGNIDLIVFSGDLTQRGQTNEFDRVTSILSEVWSIFASAGSSPKFVVVPGNHDLERPSVTDPALLLLKQWWESEAVRKSTLSDPKSIYRKAISKAFRNYDDWLARLASSGIPLAARSTGLLPGDFSSALQVGDKRVGIVGLNSSWLQLDETDVRGRLNVDPRQLLAVTDGDADAWCAQNEANLIVTHHPLAWHHDAAQTHWHSEIHPPGRFDAHLFGHMHEPDTSTIARGGSRARVAIQAASLFGLERIGQLRHDRIHGFSVGQIAFGTELVLWPRKATRLTSGAWKLVPDHQLDLDRDDSIKIALGSASPGEATPAPESHLTPSPVPSLIRPGTDKRAILERVRFYVLASPASSRVRRVEQQVALAGLAESRAIWITADWGSGEDGFVRTIQDRLNIPSGNTFKLDLSEYTTRSEFLSSIKPRVGFSLEEICEALSDTGTALLVLDDVPVSSSNAPSKASTEIEIEELSKTILNYCDNIQIIIRTRNIPRAEFFSSTILKPLDEADLRNYVSDHEHGGAELLTKEAISSIFRHTDGVPARIDATLRELEIITPDQLTTTNTDLRRMEGRLDDVPLALVEAIDMLASSEEPVRKRSFELLKALCVFPRGESIDRLKRFNGSHPFFLTHALELMDSSLIKASAPSSGPTPQQSQAKILVVPRPVRDYVRSEMTFEELREAAKRAATLYFGHDWHLGKLRPSLADRFRDSLATDAEMTNATSIVLRLLNDAFESDDKRAIRASLDIARAYLAALLGGDHYRNATVFARDLLAYDLSEHFSDAEFFRYELARGLRMSGDYGESVALLESLDQTDMPSGMRQSVELSLALAHQSLKNVEASIAAAKRVLKIGRNTHQSLQARGLLIEQGENSEDVAADLLKLEDLCRRRGATIAANNLALSRAKEHGKSEAEIDLALDSVIKSSSTTKDFYNRARAITQKIEHAISRGRRISDQDKAILIDAYQFLFNERLSSMFDNCHKVLWDLFESLGETANLFRLFRHSSLIWRLRGDEKNEGKYLQRLARHAEAVILVDIGRLDRETAYYLVRAGAASTRGASSDSPSTAQ